MRIFPPEDRPSFPPWLRFFQSPSGKASITGCTMDQRAMREEGVKLFYERGFTGTTLDDIAAELGVTKPFIYTHFRSKTDLLAALCKPTIELSLEAVSRAAKMPGSPTARLHRAIAGFTQVVLSRQANIAIYFREE